MSHATKSGTTTTRVVCAVCFLAFSFLWLYWFQGDLLAVAQHTLSGGMTRYDRTVGAVIITVVLFLLQLAIHAVTRLSRRTHALTYAPSFLALAFLSDIDISADGMVTVGGHKWLLAMMFALWMGAVWLSRQLLPFSDGDKQATGLFSARTWINLAQLVVMMLFTASVANTRAVHHFRAHAETALLRGDSREALHAGWESLETDPQLTMLRAYALSREGQLGDRLFCYPVAGSGADLLPMRQAPLLLPADSIWRHLGGKPAFPIDADLYYHLLQLDSLTTPAVADYRLCALLIDRRIEDFARLLPQYYNCATIPNEATSSLLHHQAASTLPRHYREALVLCRHELAGSVAQIDDDVIEQEWEQMQAAMAKYPEGSEQQLQMLEKYRNTYWRYYYNR